jgi:hypothetical protein
MPKKVSNPSPHRNDRHPAWRDFFCELTDQPHCIGTYNFYEDNFMGSREINEIVVTDIRMSFSSMVVFMVKWAVATIPALIILTVVGSILLGILRIIFGGFHPGMRF